MRRHAVALRHHVRDLADRNYPRAVGADALEVTIAFVPIEGALSAALGFDEDLQTANFLPNLFNKADAPRLYRPVCVGNSAPCSGSNRRAADPSALVAGFVPTGDNTIDGAYIGRIVPNTGKLLNGVLQAGKGIENGLYRNRGIHFAPRFGFAYDLKGDQNIVVRGGGGMFYDRPQGNVVFDLLGNPPTTLSPTFFFGQMQTLNTGQVLLAPPALVAYDHEGKSPTSYAFNLGVQVKLPMDSVLDVSYVGTLGSHLLQRRNINAPVYGAAYQGANQDPTLAANTTGANALPVDFLRPYQGFGNISYIEPASSSNYHSMQTSLNRRFKKGLLLGITHTWSKALGTQAVDLPGINGFEVTTELRRLGLYVPVLILTARGRSEDVLSGFGAGADDYLTKPFELPIFLSRVRGLLRRHEWFRLDAARKSATAEYAFAGRVIDFELLELRVGDKRMPLTMMEAALLRYFVENEGKPVARKTILDRVWNVHEDTDTRAIDNFVVRLRRYIENEPARPRHLIVRRELQAERHFPVPCRRCRHQGRIALVAHADIRPCAP